MSDRFHVTPDSLDAAADRQETCAETARLCAEQLMAAISTGNAFGILGELAGTRANYDDWAGSEVQALHELTRCLGDMAQGLRLTAQSYRDADQAGLDVLNATYRGGTVA